MSRDVPPGWPAAGSFYSSPDWFRFVDSDGVSEPFYAVSGGAGIVAHHGPGDRHPDYRPESVLGIDDGPRLLVGGRRGFCSPVVGRDVPGSTLAALLGEALDANPDVRGNWWWPYLPTEDLARVVGAARELDGAEPGVFLVGADCVIDDVRPDEPYDEALNPKQRRTNWRREWRRFRESGLELRRMPLADVVEPGARLLRQVEQKYGNLHTEEYLISFLQRQARFLADAAVVHAILDGSRITGFSLSYRWGEELALRLVGLDYGALRDAAEYAVLLAHAPVGYAREHGFTRLHLGMDGFEAKCRRGARVRPLWAVAPRTTSAPEALSDRASSLAAGLPATERSAFLAEVGSVRRSIPTPSGGSA